MGERGDHLTPCRQVSRETNLAGRQHGCPCSRKIHLVRDACRLPRASPILSDEFGKRFEPPQINDDLRADLTRLEFLWRDTQQRFGGEGGYLLGAFSAADAMYAPVVTRLDTYQLPVAEDTRTYMDKILNNNAFVEWKQQALAEPWSIADYEAGHTVVEDYRTPTY